MLSFSIINARLDVRIRGQIHAPDSTVQTDWIVVSSADLWLSAQLDQMHERGIKANVYIYNALIKAHALIGDMGQVAHWL